MARLGLSAPRAISRQARYPVDRRRRRLGPGFVGVPAAPALSATAQLLSTTAVPLLVPLPLTLTTVTLGSVGGTGNDAGSIDTSFTGGFQSDGRSQPDVGRTIDRRRRRL